MGAHRQKVIAMVGPTASGKTPLAIELAKRFSGELIAVDSRTVYRGMDIGTAKPKTYPHFGLDLVDPDETYSVALFKIYAQKKIQEIAARGHVPILVGGTGLWMDVVLRGYEIPEVAPNETLRAELEKKSVSELLDDLRVCDPKGAEEIDQKNERRLIRALEVCLATGRPFSSLKQKNASPYDVLWIGLSVPRAELEQRINARADEMMQAGLLDEARGLFARFGKALPAMSGIGYGELVAHLEGKISLEEAVARMKIHTRQFAKRQMTWFARDKNTHWIRSPEEAFNLASEFLSYQSA